MQRINQQSTSFWILLLGLLMVSGCTGHLVPPAHHQETTRNSRFVIITAGEQDTLESLARTYLKDSRQAWRIAAYNQIEHLNAGQRVVIPRVPTQHGGLRIDGYQTVPILVYLNMASAPRQPDTVSARAFERQLNYLSENGFTTISLDQLNAFLNLRGDLPPNALVISMDTTRTWAYDIAYPALKRHAMKAALFFNVDQVGQKSRLTWPQISKMAADGIDMGLHGDPLRAPPKESLAAYLNGYEEGLRTPKKFFLKRLKIPCRYFAYASGKSDDLTISLLKKHGYRAGFTHQRGSNPFFIDDFMLRRSVIHGHYDMQKFRRNLTTFRAMELK